MKQNFIKNLNWQIPHIEDSREFSTIDMHTGGEPLRVVLDGIPDLQGNNVLEYRRFLRDNHDHLRTALMHEPRGHSDMYGCILTPPNDDQADFGVVFIHNEGYSTMCGHAVIALGKLAATLGWVSSSNPSTVVTIDAPCGRIFTEVENHGNQFGKTSFEGVPSFVIEDSQIEIPGIGSVGYTVAYGGAFYAYVDAPSIGLSLDASNQAEIIELAKRIKQHIIERGAEIHHPFENDLSFLYGVIFTGGEASSDCFDRNVCVFAEGEVDRSPTGSGVSGRMAIHYYRNDIKLNEEVKIESICGSTFQGVATREVEYGPYKAIIPKVTGEAWITGTNQFIIDPDDPFRNGFLLR